MSRSVAKVKEDYITAHFRWHEFACTDGTEVPDKYRKNIIDLAIELEHIRAIWKRPMTVLSGYRTKAWNTKVGGVKASQHMLGKAADIIVAGYSPAAVYAGIELAIAAGQVYDGGLGLYRGWVHYDIRKHHSRWKG